MDLKFSINGEKAPLILIHCAQSSSKIWQDNISELSEYFKIISYDLRGHGESVSYDNSFITIENHVEDLKKLVQKLKLQKYSLCGLSMGALIAQEFYKKYKEPESIILISSPAYSIFGKNYLISSTLVFILKFFIKLMNKTMIENIAISMFGYLSIQKKKFVLNEIQNCDKLTSKSDFLNIISFTHIFSKRFKPINLEIIVGENDAKRVHKHANYFSKISGKPIIVIPNSGHLPNFENPSYFNKKIIELKGDYA